MEFLPVVCHCLALCLLFSRVRPANFSNFFSSDGFFFITFFTLYKWKFIARIDYISESIQLSFKVLYKSTRTYTSDLSFHWIEIVEPNCVLCCSVVDRVMISSICKSYTMLTKTTYWSIDRWVDAPVPHVNRQSNTPLHLRPSACDRRRIRHQFLSFYFITP